MYPTPHIWSDATWNPVGGCSAISTGCKNCYAAQLAGTQQTAHRISIYLRTTDWVRGKPVFNGTMTAAEAGHDVLVWPLVWPGARQPLLGKGKPSLIFVCDMCDLFHENRPVAIIDRVVITVAESPHIGQLLTKRPELMAKYFSALPYRPMWQRHLWLGFSAERHRSLTRAGRICVRWPRVDTPYLYPPHHC
jgi:protein gp37